MGRSPQSAFCSFFFQLNAEILIEHGGKPQFRQADEAAGNHRVEEIGELKVVVAP